MSLTIESYNHGDYYLEYRWDKYAPHYEVFVGERRIDGLIHTIWKRRYETKDEAKRSFKRQVAKIKKGEKK